MKTRLRAIVMLAAIAALGACNPNAPKCRAPIASPVHCPPGVFVDTTHGDPICLDGASGEPICRGAASSCYVCSGPRFTDGCYASSVGTYECVHDCTKC